MSAPRRAANVRQMQIPQNGQHIVVEIVDGIEIGTNQREMDKGVVEQILGFLPVALGKLQRPIQEPLVALNKQVFVAEFWF